MRLSRESEGATNLKTKFVNTRNLRRYELGDVSRFHGFCDFQLVFRSAAAA
jgi:hypothetical protein